MELHTLQQKLAKQIATNDIEIKNQQAYSIPVHTVQVSYYPVQRSAMDILMKMMLISYEKANFTDPTVLAEVLLVEPLFIHDLTNKMLKMGLLSKEGGPYKLTSKGKQQKEEGIFEEQLELQVSELLYSTVHNQFLDGDLEEATDFDEFPDAFPYIEEEQLTSLDPQLMIDELIALQPEPNEDTPLTFITATEHYESIQIHDVPILQFICYEKASNRFFARIFNTLTNEWDSHLESIVHTKERTSWSEHY